ncbi:hypothetical protein A2Z33_03465 [Candidatus Gottesmanbacteria bacterium RBG_16_52_11]|uniref:Vitamin K epoxide reductase domain-containing protein n=1 Tax=Candidatus Gottesmanbacteria bacterium RBG_16_52_11 TaxID=1798374 RepID=A0A1F5YW41_9BACT|nr:MAG: hypothetical protein A2Z33_03465 [Candidatus Gottesmanbacteria bacterium RBG_16_52_11]
MTDSNRTIAPDDRMVNRIIFVLSLLGLIMAIYVLQSFLRSSSIICLTGSGCEVVRKSAAAWPFGIPVPAVGAVGYTFLSVLALLRTIRDDRRLIMGILGMAAFGVVFVTWFTYTEIFVIRGICSWCVLSAVNMFVIFALTMMTVKKHRLLGFR